MDNSISNKINHYEAILYKKMYKQVNGVKGGIYFLYWDYNYWMQEVVMVIGDGQGSLACYSPWSHKELDMTERLNWSWSWRRNDRNLPCGEHFSHRYCRQESSIDAKMTEWKYDKKHNIWNYLSTTYLLLSKEKLEILQWGNLAKISNWHHQK